MPVLEQTGIEKVLAAAERGELGAHAILLYGPRGAGKGGYIHRLAQAWLRKSSAEDDRAVAAFRRGNNPDFLEIRPVGPSAIIKLAAITYTDGPKTPGADDHAHAPLQQFFRMQPLMSANKVVAILRADRMNADATNALLKTLEEPFPNGKLILTTTSMGRIPATIISRCLAVACGLPTNAELKRLYPNADDEEIRLADGAPGRLAEILQHREAYGEIIRFAEQLFTRSPDSFLRASEELTDVAEGIADSTKINRRAAIAETLECLAIYLRADARTKPTWVETITEAHRRILQNGADSIVLDWMLSQLLLASG